MLKALTRASSGVVTSLALHFSGCAYKNQVIRCAKLQQVCSYEKDVKSFKTGLSTKLHGSVCYYYQSFVGRDFKGWTQMALFNLGPYLSDGQKEVLLAFSKVSIAINI